MGRSSAAPLRRKRQAARSRPYRAKVAAAAVEKKQKWDSSLRLLAAGRFGMTGRDRIEMKKNRSA